MNGIVIEDKSIKRTCRLKERPIGQLTAYAMLTLTAYIIQVEYNVSTTTV